MESRVFNKKVVTNKKEKSSKKEKMMMVMTIISFKDKKSTYFRHVQQLTTHNSQLTTDD